MRIINKSILSLTFIFCAAAAFGQPALVDTTFNGTGRSVVDFSPFNDTVTKVLIQSTGKIVLAGTSNRDTFSPFMTNYFSLTRLNTDGTLDTTFGDQGKVINDFNPAGHNEPVLSAAIQADDKIILVGLAQTWEPGVIPGAIMRFNADGSVDNSFGTGGKLTLSIAGSSSTQFYGVTAAPSGEIAVAARYWNGGSMQTGVIRLSSTGTILATGTNFQDVGSAGYNVPSSVRIQPDGKIVSGGYTQQGGQLAYSIKLVRFNPDGTQDNTFGTAGVVWENLGVIEIIDNIEILPDGRIIASGKQGHSYLVMRFLSNGQLDPSFGTNGRMVSPIYTEYADPVDLVVRPNGKILLAGRSVNEIAVAYYNADGSPDTTFDGDGIAVFNFVVPNQRIIPTTVVVDNTGRVVLGGVSSEGLTSTAFAATRLKSLDIFPTTIAGRAVTAEGFPIRNVRVGLTNSQGVTVWALTNAFGSFQFDNILSGQTCNLFVRGSKTYIFEGVDVPINSAVTNIDLVGTPRGQPLSKPAVLLSKPVMKRKSAYLIESSCSEVKMFKSRLNLFLIVAVILGASSSICAQPEVDITFNGNGRVTGEFGITQSVLNEVLVQPDNKIITVGTWQTPNSNSYFALTRHNEDGSLDLTFGDRGHVYTDFHPVAAGEGANAAVIQPDGKIVAAGYVRVINPGEAYFALARYNTNGSLDNTFGSGGLVLTGDSNRINEAAAVALAPDGKIAAAGFYFDGIRFQVMVTVYSSTGVPLWTGVDNRGFALGDSNKASAVSFQTDGKIMVAGFTSNSSETGIAFIRFNADGTKDNTFGFLGRLLVSNTQSELINALTVLPDGRIISVGRMGSDLMVRRMFGSGMHDISFSDDGRATASFSNGSQGNALLIRPDGKILVAGYGTSNFSLAMFNTNGTLDTSFSGDGKLVFDFPGFSSSAAQSMAIDSLGRIVLGGNVANKYALARLYTLDSIPVTIAGRAITPEGTPIRGARIGLTDSHGNTYWSITTAFGFFQFDNVPTGQTCNVFVRGSKTHLFEALDIGVNSAMSNIELVGTPRTNATKGNESLPASAIER